MRKTLLFLMLLSVKLTFSQVSDDFSDGNFTTNPRWSGQDSHFMINSLKQLQTKVAANSQVVTLVTENLLATNVACEFFLQLNFDPSATNQVRIYLMSDVSDLQGPVNGYFIQIGENGNTDSFDLFRQNGNIITKIIDGAPKSRLNVNQLTASIRVTRSDIGKWDLFADMNGGSNYALEGSVIDLSIAYTDWFGLSCKYTSTRSDGFILDNFSIRELSPDVTPPSLVKAQVIDERTIEATFSERLTPQLAVLENNYNILGIGSPTQVTATNLPHVFKLSYAAILQSGAYRLTVERVKDLSGNLIADHNSAAFIYVKPNSIKAGDILISEVLVNPKSGGVDFIEIYNNSNQILDLKELRLANVDDNGDVANIKNVSDTSVFMFPRTYWVLTSNSSIVQNHYYSRYVHQFVQMKSLPTYNNDEGTVILLSTNGQTDRLDYSEKMHFPLLQNDDGVALERVSFIRPTNEKGNFRSAAQSVGFATPSYQNSQEDSHVERNAISLSSKTFSPDGDGFEDFLEINYQFISNGYLANINIYTEKGILIRRLQRNITIASNGNFKWDGLNDAGVQSKVGIYIIKFDAFTLGGETKSFKQTCVLASKLN